MLFGWEELRRELRREEAEEREVVPLERVADRRGGHHPDVAPRRRRRYLAGRLQVELVPSPSPRIDREGDPRALDTPFSGIVFKVQANMDKAHRDRVAFLRVCSGQFDRGMVVTHEPTGKPFATKSSLEHLESKLKGHAMFQGPDKLDRLKMCEDCRVVQMTSEDENPLAHGTVPVPRTTDDYLRERDELREKAKQDMEKKGLTEGEA